MCRLTNKTMLLSLTVNVLLIIPNTLFAVFTALINRLLHFIAFCITTPRSRSSITPPEVYTVHFIFYFAVMVHNMHYFTDIEGHTWPVFRSWPEDRLEVCLHR